ncbi:ATP-dependent DNA helicase RecG [Nostocoides veronense]|uniref:ATP-dependent DNA helicase RecG n=1 Tax=Nostocoides veronense TaxID=330836 RepID=A0ABN2LXD8_9MICO
MARLDSTLSPLIASAAKHLRDARGIVTVADLLAFHPTRYLSYDSELEGLHEGEFVVVIGTIKSASTRRMSTRKGAMLTAVLTDGVQQVDMTFFSARAHESKLIPGVRVIAGGQVGRYNGRWQLAHPGYTLLDDAATAALPGLYPVYPAVPKLHNWNLVQAIGLVLDALDPVPDPIPPKLRARHDLVDLDHAVRALHRPTSRAAVVRARDRLRYEEALVLQTVLAQRRARKAQDEAAIVVPGGGALTEAFAARLPFALTDGQRAVGAEIAADLAQPVPMNRLLQGEVGSGKTVLALQAMLQVVDAGAQAALLAPTEVLAVQHHRSITAMLGDLAEGGLLGGSEIGTRVALLTGSQGSAQRRRALADVVSGEAGIVVGTHALLQEKVAFYNLGLVVVDEQHRFGVEQRDALRGKAEVSPHVLVMTATPIPRTIAMTVFGDMETSTLTELPAGRSPIQTFVVDEFRPGWLERTWARIGEECRGGRQAYVVCPRIGPGAPEEGGDLDWPEPDPVEDGTARLELLGVLETVEALRAEPALAGLEIGLLHGKLPADEKDAVMAAFAAGEIDVLVATTVIEVGVDVPNATIMVVRDADRFGVSQLHQLRGRVGRGAHPGLCLLTTRAAEGPAGERLAAVAATTDGFELAALDLRQRREGDILGARQSGGRGRLRYLSLAQHESVIAAARADAAELVAADPELAQHPLLAGVIEAWLRPEQADFLEKG